MKDSPNDNFDVWIDIYQLKNLDIQTKYIKIIATPRDLISTIMCGEILINPTILKD